MDPSATSATESTEVEGSDAARGLRILRVLVRQWRAGVFDASSTTPLEADAAEAFVRDLESLGPAFVKVGQMLSTRADLVHPDALVALERMQDAVAPLPWHVMQREIERGLGAPTATLFARIDHEPIGSASLAQVYRAALPDGRAVAVKVQRPDVEAAIKRDLDLLLKIARGLDRYTRIGQRLKLQDWIGEFRESLLRELDYNAEADNLERFAEHLRPYESLLVPLPLRSHLAPTVLTMQLVRGRRIDSAPRPVADDRADALASELVRAYLDQALLHGEIHADPHPGNLLVTDDGRLALLDLGMVANVSPQRRDQLMRMLLGVADGRGEDVADELATIGEPLEAFDRAGLQRDVARLVARYATGEQPAPTEGRLLLELVRLSTVHGLRPAAELSLLGKALLNLDASRALLAPDLVVRDLIATHLSRIAADRLREGLNSARFVDSLHQVQALVAGAPKRLDSLLAILAENRLQVRITGLEEARLVENLQKIANRIAAGVIVAALILASALVVRAGPAAGVPGYSAIAIGLFLLATALGLTMVVQALRTDRSAPPRREP